MSTTIEDRFILILREQISSRDDAIADEKSVWAKLKRLWSPPAFPGRGAWEAIEQRTGISSQSWRGAYTRRQKPTIAMIEAIAKLFPRYAFWLATGITDGTNGHVAPRTALTFPERLYVETHYGNMYFDQSIELANRLYEQANIDLTDEKQRMFAVERTKPLAHWFGSPLLNTAYELAKSDEYKRLIKLWHDREEERKHDLDKIEGRSRPWVEKQKKLKLKGAGDPIFSVDPRVTHQDQWDLFYLPKSNDDKAS